MSWLDDQRNKIQALKLDLEELDELIESSSRNSFNEAQYDTIIREREYLRGYIHCIQQRIIMYCSTCSQCEECDDVTVHLVLGE